MTIGHFPVLYPDELLYSGFARCRERLGLSGSFPVMRTLYGLGHYHPHQLMPKQLDAFYNRLPPGYPLSMTELLAKHTLLPYHAPFLDGDAAQVAQQCFRGELSFREHFGTLSIFAMFARMVPTLRYCPGCVHGDRDQYGEAYWHRLHHMAGVAVCPKHNCFLQASRVRIHSFSQAFLTLEESLAQDNVAALKPIDPTERGDQVLLWVAEATRWLLDREELQGQREHIHARYLNALLAQGYIDHNSLILENRLRNALSHTYPPALLARLGLPQQSQQWHPMLNSLHTRHRPKMHPLRHILLIHVLGYTLSAFFDLPDTFVMPAKRPFGDGPWPCLNAQCPDYGRDVIHACQVRTVPRRPRPLPCGTFSCPSCGAIYERVGADTRPQRRWSVSCWVMRGSLWEDCLRKAWADRSLKFNEICNAFKLGGDHLKFHAQRLDLPFPRFTQGRGCKQLAPTNKVYPATPSRAGHPSVRREDYRAQLLNLIAQLPELSRQEVRRRLPKEWGWLDQCDHDWFYAHLPPLRRSRWDDYRRETFWGPRDTKLAQAIRHTAQALYAAPGKPLKVTATRLLKLQHVLSYKYCLADLPLTAQALADCAEDHHEFCLRRLHWAAQLCLKTKRRVSVVGLVRVAGSKSALRSPSLAKAACDIWHNLIATLDAERPVAKFIVVKGTAKLALDYF